MSPKEATRPTLLAATDLLTQPASQTKLEALVSQSSLMAKRMGIVRPEEPLAGMRRSCAVKAACALAVCALQPVLATCSYAQIIGTQGTQYNTSTGEIFGSSYNGGTRFRLTQFNDSGVPAASTIFRTQGSAALVSVTDGTTVITKPVSFTSATGNVIVWWLSPGGFSLSGNAQFQSVSSLQLVTSTSISPSSLFQVSFANDPLPYGAQNVYTHTDAPISISGVTLAVDNRLYIDTFGSVAIADSSLTAQSGSIYILGSDISISGTQLNAPNSSALSASAPIVQIGASLASEPVIRLLNSDITSDAAGGIYLFSKTADVTGTAFSIDPTITATLADSLSTNASGLSLPGCGGLDSTNCQSVDTSSSDSSSAQGFATVSELALTQGVIDSPQELLVLSNPEVSVSEQSLTVSSPLTASTLDMSAAMTATTLASAISEGIREASSLGESINNPDGMTISSFEQISNLLMRLRDQIRSGKDQR